MEKWLPLIPLLVALGGWYWTWRNTKRADRVDPLSAAATATSQMAETVTELIAPMQQELRRLRVEVMVLRETLAAHGIQAPDPAIIAALVKDLE